MGEDLETRQAEFYHEWWHRKAGKLSVGAMFFGPIGSRLELREWKQALALLVLHITISVLFAEGHEMYAIALFGITWFYEFVSYRFRVERFNTALEKELIEKWGEDAVSK